MDVGDTYVKLIIAGGESEDEIGVALRVHLAVERLLEIFIEQKRTVELKTFIKEPREFGAKLSLCAAFGLPVPLLKALHQINVIRNKLAHGSDSLALSDVQQLGRMVDGLSDLYPDFRPLSERYMELANVRPGEKIRFGDAGNRLDFYMASMVLFQAMICWLEGKSDMEDVELRANSAPTERRIKRKRS